MPELIHFFNNIQKQFLCCYPLHCIPWQDLPKDLTWDQQKTLIDVTYNFYLNRELPIKLSYQLNFLKKLIAFLEQNSSEVHDAVYESYCQVQLNVAKDSTEKYAFKHYILNPNTHFTLRESKSFVAEGTTGLCSWQASLALADFLIQHPDIIRNKSVLELGAGTGLCGFITLKLCQPKHLLLSDGSEACVELMCESIKRNFVNAIDNNSQRFSIDEQIVECSVIPWESIHKIDRVSQLKPDVILAADVVYDESCFADLCFAIDFVFKLKEDHVQMFLAATVRNQHTLNEFIKTLDSLNFKITEHPVVPQQDSYLHWDRTTPVKIFNITR